jgi:hypothetical protein
MKHRKSIGYAFPTSACAKELGHGSTGCYFIQQETRLEDGTWSPADVWPGTHGEAAESLDAPHLIDLYFEIDAPIGPYCHFMRNRHG